MTESQSLTRLRRITSTMILSGGGSKALPTMLQPPAVNFPDSEEKTKSSKRSLARSSSSESRRKKISLAREMLHQSPWLPKKTLARELGIARSTLYRTPQRSEKDKALLLRILTIMEEHPYYGQPRIALEMGRNIKLVRRVMRKYGLKSK